MWKTIVALIPQRIKDRPINALAKLTGIVLIALAVVVLLLGREFVKEEWRRLTTEVTEVIP